MLGKEKIKNDLNILIEIIYKNYLRDSIMVNLKCRKLFMRGKDFCCLVKGEVITDCDKDCKDMVLSKIWKDIPGEENNIEDKNIKEL